MGMMTKKRMRRLEAAVGDIDDTTDAMVAPLTRGSIFRGSSAGKAEQLDAKTDTQILVGDGTDVASVAVSGDATLANTGALTIGADKVNEQKMLMSTVIPVPIQAVLGNRGGANSDGVMVGTITHTAAADVTSEDNSGATFVDDTADAASAAAGDVAVGPDPFDTSDALYIGHGTIFSAVVTKVGTAGAGDATAAETAWEYWNGSAWAALTEVLDTSVEFTAGTATYVTSFLPPSDWAATTVDGGSSLFFVRFISSADDVYNTTQPVLSQMWVLPLATGGGPSIPFDCTITDIDATALVASATNDDTEILLVNLTQGTFAQMTWTGGDLADSTGSLTLAFTAGDEFAVQILTEDGTTEFDGACLYLTASIG